MRSPIHPPLLWASSNVQNVCVGHYTIKRGSEWGGPLVGCRLKFSYFVGSRLKFSIFVGCRLSVNLS